MCMPQCEPCHQHARPATQDSNIKALHFTLSVVKRQLNFIFVSNNRPCQPNSRRCMPEWARPLQSLFPECTSERPAAKLQVVSRSGERDTNYTIMTNTTNCRHCIVSATAAYAHHNPQGATANTVWPDIRRYSGGTTWS